MTISNRYSADLGGSCIEAALSAWVKVEGCDELWIIGLFQLPDSFFADPLAHRFQVFGGNRTAT